MIHLIVGAGGIASWLVPLLKHTLEKEANITVLDGDILMPENLDRQFFSEDYIGYNKAAILAEVYYINHVPDYLSQELAPSVAEPSQCIWCCADNHQARKLCLQMVDAGQALMALIGGNEYTDSEAYAYYPAWKGLAGDPRSYYPEILLDESGDPLSPFACQGVAQATNRQLALANYLAAGFMVHLWWFMTHYGSEVIQNNWPLRHFSNFSSFHTKPYDIPFVP